MGFTGTLDVDIDWFVSDLVEIYENHKLCKGKTLFRLKGDKDDSFRIIKIPYGDPKAKAYLEKYGGKQVIEILNDECQQFA